MPDVCDLILDDHERFRRRFAELDGLRRGGTAGDPGAVWGPLADLLEVHAAAEEALFYPRLLREGSDGEEETRDALQDHNDIRDAIARAAGLPAGSDEWWETVLSARATNSDHIAEEERGAIADFRVHSTDDEREALGVRWVEFEVDHAGARGVDAGDQDVDRYISRRG